MKKNLSARCSILLVGLFVSLLVPTFAYAQKGKIVKTIGNAGKASTYHLRKNVTDAIKNVPTLSKLTVEGEFTGKPIIISPQQIPDISAFYDANYSNNSDVQAEQLYSFVYDVTQVADRLVASKVFNFDKLAEYATKELPKVEATGYHFPGEINLGLEQFIDTKRFMRTRGRTFEYDPIILKPDFKKQDLEEQLKLADEHISQEKPYLLEKWKDMDTNLALPAVFIYYPAYRTDFWESQVGLINYYSISHIFVYLKAPNRPAGWYRVSGSSSELKFTPVGRTFYEQSTQSHPNPQE